MYYRKIITLIGVGLLLGTAQTIAAGPERDVKERLSGGHVLGVPLVGQAVLDLQREITEIEAKMASHVRPGHIRPGTNRVIVLGPTGSGKSTLVNFLAGKRFEAKNRGGIVYLDTADLLPGFNLGHRVDAGTRVPASWHDERNNAFYFDCPGFGDPRGSKADISNLFFIHQLFSNNPRIKILLVVPERTFEDPRAVELVRLLNDLTTVFPDDGLLRRSLSLTISRHKEMDPAVRLEALCSDFEKQAPAERLLTPRGLELLKFLSDNAATRVATFSSPRGEGKYEFSSEEIEKSIKSAEYIPNLRFDIALDGAQRDLIGTAASSINSQISHFLRGEGSERLVAYFNNRIQGHAGTVGGLRTALDGDLGRLKEVVVPEAFAEQLATFFDASTVRGSVNRLSFLRSLKADIPWSIAEWRTALNTLFEQVDILKATPLVEHKGAVLRLKGPIIGTTDVVEALRVNLIDGPINFIEAYGLNTLFLDANITCHGASLSLFAPQWKTIGDIRIDLSGIEGKAGAHGAVPSAAGNVGGVGGNGGHFYGRGQGFTDIARLTVITGGGRGGAGGSGAAGANGVNGRTVIHRIDHRGPFGIGHHHEEVPVYIQPTNGQQGGKGGVGGKGGRAGSAVIHGALWTQPYEHRTSIEGKNGAPGAGGINGTDPGQAVGARGSALAGTPPTEADLLGRVDPAPSAPLDSAALIRGYDAYYLSQVPTVRPFVRVFSNRI